MAAVQAMLTRTGWRPADRVLVAALAVLLAFGTPGFGFETRHPSNEATLTAIAFVLFVLPLATVALSFVRPVLAARLGMVTGALLAVLTLLDLVGVMIGTPPAAMAVIDGLLVAAGVVTVVRCWAIGHAG